MNDSDGIRLQEFCQFKKEIRGSTDYLIVGLDIAKERHNAFFGTATGRTLHKGMFFDNTYDGFQKLLIQRTRSRCNMACAKWFSAWNPRPITINLWESISSRADTWLFWYLLLPRQRTVSLWMADGISTTPRMPRMLPT